MASHGLEGASLEVPEDDDVSEMGIEIIIFDEAGSLSEEEDAYPGIVVAKDGFVPVGGCAVGSGDQYFINAADGEGGPLYRIYHDMFAGDDYNRDEAIDTVLNSYAELSKYKNS